VFPSTSARDPLPRRRGFTLIELIVAISIVLVLAAIAIPVTSQVTHNSRLSAGVSNLRQIMIATLSFTVDNGKLFPSPMANPDTGQFDEYFYTALTGYMETGARLTTSGSRFSPIFQDPLAAINRGDNHFTANRNVMSWNIPRRITEFSDPSRVVVYFDGAQVHNGNVEAAGWAVDGASLNGIRAMDRSPEWLSTPIAKGPNTDTASSQGNIRWRVRNDSAAKFAFMDGRVEVLTPSQVTRNMFVLD
jgi:prepilin-type N-terminal cleavage/methylation domain-containing protein